MKDDRRRESGSERSNSSGRVRRFLLAAALLTLASVAAAPPASAVLEGRNGRIVFTSGREGANDNLAQIYLRTVTSSTGGGTVSGPVGIPGVQNRHASWSPDRTRIVFAAGTPGSPTTEEYDIFVRDLVANTVTPLDATQVGDGLDLRPPRVVPGRHEGRLRAAAGRQQRRPRHQGQDRRQRGAGAEPDDRREDRVQASLEPRLADRSTTRASRRVAPASNLDILKKPVGGGTATPVANATGVDEYQPSISPDGSQICFTLQSVTGSPASAEIYTASLPSLTGLTDISDDATKGDINCTWSPDSTQIAYVNGVFSQGRLVMERSDDSSLFPVDLEDDVGSNNFDGNPDWAPDGSPDCPDGTAVDEAGQADHDRARMRRHRAGLRAVRPERVRRQRRRPEARHRQQFRPHRQSLDGRLHARPGLRRHRQDHLRELRRRSGSGPTRARSGSPSDRTAPARP